jgi:hypothetical protein
LLHRRVLSGDSGKKRHNGSSEGFNLDLKPLAPAPSWQALGFSQSSFDGIDGVSNQLLQIGASRLRANGKSSESVQRVSQAEKKTSSSFPTVPSPRLRWSYVPAPIPRYSIYQPLSPLYYIPSFQTAAKRKVERRIVGMEAKESDVR